MEFASWREWSPSEVAFFISTFCELPQYATAIGQNLSGQALQRLSAANMLTKGLSRAGVCDYNHQQLIAVAVEKLEKYSVEELSEELNMRLQENVKWRNRHRRPAPPHTARGARRPRRRQIEVDLRLWEIEAMNSARPMSPTAEGMQRPSTADAHVESVSESRFTPRPWNHITGVASSRDAADLDAHYPLPSQAEAGCSQRLRERLATNLKEYEIMRQTVDPLYVTISPRTPRPTETSRRPQTSPTQVQPISETIVDISTSTGSKEPAPISPSREDKRQSNPRSNLPKASSESSVTGAGEILRQDSRSVFRQESGTIKRQESSSIKIGTSVASKDSQEMMQGLLGSQGKDDLAAGGGLQAVQKIQAQRQHQKETQLHECGHNTLETMTNVLGTNSGSGDYSDMDKSDSQKTHPGVKKNHSGDGMEVDRSDLVSQHSSQHSSPEKKSSRHSTLSSPDKIKMVTSTSRSQHDEEQRAAVKVQSYHRQRQAMREAELRRHNKKEAAIKSSQEHSTADHAQQLVQRKKEESEKKLFDEQLKAATRIQSIHRGNQARAAYYEKHHKETSSQDGHKGPSSPPKKRSLSEESAAKSIQAKFRGNQDRKTASDRRHSTASSHSNSSRKSGHR